MGGGDSITTGSSGGGGHGKSSGQKSGRSLLEVSSSVLEPSDGSDGIGDGELPGGSNGGTNGYHGGGISPLLDPVGKVIESHSFELDLDD